MSWKEMLLTAAMSLAAVALVWLAGYPVWRFLHRRRPLPNLVERHFWVNIHDGQIGLRARGLVLTLNWDFGLWRLGARLEIRTCPCEFHIGMYERLCLNVAAGPFSTELTIGDRIPIRHTEEEADGCERGNPTS